MSIWWILFFYVLGYLGGLLHGYTKGVNETEKRWSAATIDREKYTPDYEYERQERYNRRRIDDEKRRSNYKSKT